MRPVKAFCLKGIGNSFGGVIHVEWECDARTPDGEWILWDDCVSEFVHAALDDSQIAYESSRAIMDGMAFDLTYEWYKDIPQLVKDWEWAMDRILEAISWHVCPVCSRTNFTFMQPFTNTDDVYERQECDCDDEDFTDMLIDEEANESNE